MEVVRGKKNYGFYFVYWKGYTSFSKKTAIKEIVSTCRMFCRQWISRNDYLVQRSCKRQCKGCTNSSPMSKFNLRTLDKKQEL